MSTKEKHFDELSHYINSRFKVDDIEYSISISINRDEEGFITVEDKNNALLNVTTIDEEFREHLDNARPIFTEIDKYIQSIINKWR